jgi:hypothetical protein
MVDLHCVAASSHSLAARGSLSWRLLPGPERPGQDGREVAQTQQQSCWRVSPSQLLERPLLHQQQWASTPRCWRRGASCSTTCLRPECRPQWSSSGITMSTSSSSPPSTRHTVRGGASHLRSRCAFRQRRMRHPWRNAPGAARCTPVGTAPRAND